MVNYFGRSEGLRHGDDKSSNGSKETTVGIDGSGSVSGLSGSTSRGSGRARSRRVGGGRSRWAAAGRSGRIGAGDGGAGDRASLRRTASGRGWSARSRARRRRATSRADGRVRDVDAYTAADSFGELDSL